MQVKHIKCSQRVGSAKRLYGTTAYTQVYANGSGVGLTDTSISKRVPWYSYAQQDWIKANKAAEFTGATYNRSTDTLREQRELGMKQYEMSDHLGNVLATVLDRKTGYGSSSGNYAGFSADVASITDYYPFGFPMSERSITADNLNPFRMGFNGKENDNEVYGEENFQDYGMRMYNTRLGRFISKDPLTAAYPWYTPYQFAGNKPTVYIDLDGCEESLYGLAEAGFFGETGSKIVIGTEDGIAKSVMKAWTFLSSDIWKAKTWKAAASNFNTMSDITFGNFEGRNDNLAYNVIQPKVDNFNNEVIKGDAYTRSRYFAEVGTDILLAYISSKGLSALESSAMGMIRGRLASSFYAESGFTAENALSHMEGIDFTKPVQTTILKKGTILQQWVGERGVGNYFTPLENGTAENLGLSDYSKRALKQFKLTKDVKVLKSTASDYKGNAGGGTQFFSTELKKNISPIN